MRIRLRVFCVIISLLLIPYRSAPVTAQSIPDFQVNENASPDGSEQSTPDIGGDGKGNFVITWKDHRNGTDFDIFAQIYLSSGAALNPNFKVSEEDGYASQYRPSVAVDRNLNFVITWIDNRSGDWDIYAQRFSSDGTALGGNFRVNEDSGNEEQEHPGVSIDSCGNFVIVWADDRSDDWDVYAQRYANDGTALGGNFIVNDDEGNSTQYWPSCAGDEGGGFIVTWADKRNGDYDIYVQRFSGDGAALGNNVKVNTDFGNSTQLVSTIAVDGNGDYIVAWSDKRNGVWEVYSQRYWQDGSAWGDNFQVNETVPDPYHSHPSVSADRDGNFTISWEDARNGYCDVYAQRYSATGTRIGKNFMVNDNGGESYQHSSEILVDESGEFTIAWQDYRIGSQGDIFAQFYSSDGAEVGDNYKVNDDEGSENQKDPSIAKDSNDNFVIAWTDYRDDVGDIYAQRFSSDGTELGPNFKVNGETRDDTHCDPSVAADGEGNFVIAWTEYELGSCDPNYIFAQRYSHDGTALGSNFRVNYLGADYVYGPAVACKREGGFIVTWGDAGGGGLKEHSIRGLPERDGMESAKVAVDRGSEPDIYAQQYASDGTALGDNFKVNDDVGNSYQESPAIAVDDNDNFTIAWEDNRNGEWDIYFQRFSGDGTPLGMNHRVEGSQFGDIQRGVSISADESGRFVVAWKDNRDADYDIYAQRYSNDGAAAGTNFKVNSDSGITYHSTPCISVDRAGDFIIAWSERHDGDYDIYAQRYLSGGIPYGENYQVSTAGEVAQIGPVVVLGNSRIFTTWKDNRGGQTGYDIWANVSDWDVGVGVGSHTPSPISSMPCLHQNHPNPFNPVTKIRFDLPSRERVSLNIYDPAGRLVRVLVHESIPAGRHEAIWNGLSDDGAQVGSGIYLYRIEAGSFTESRRMVLIR